MINNYFNHACFIVIKFSYQLKIIVLPDVLQLFLQIVHPFVKLASYNITIILFVTLKQTETYLTNKKNTKI